ncbi:MAG: methyltransferase domain-containing protein [Lachnospiraceae bacterium]|nr:methyltransferase domain-containing protein [Lachnospiraceae bacterium]
MKGSVIMEVNGDKWDRMLKIRTSGRDDSMSDYYHYPYEPTPYQVLERLAFSGYIRKNNVLIDYGCGKGRVGFFLTNQTRCHAIGIDYNQKVYERAVENMKTAVSANRNQFVLTAAEKYEIEKNADCFYFFNPFSVEILRAVLQRILESYYDHPRDMKLFFYYPSDAFCSYLESVDELTFIDNIDCRDLFDGENRRERILVYSLF